jgi:hypothetical protein
LDRKNFEGKKTQEQIVKDCLMTRKKSGGTGLATIEFLTKIWDDELIILVIEFGHRKDNYK